MKGADMVVYTAETDTLEDRHNLEAREPILDDCQNWTMIDSMVTEDGFMIFRARRKLDTGDPMDRAIANDALISVAPHRIIAAWGNDTGLAFHGTHRARSVVRFFGDGDDATRFLEQMEREADGSFLVAADNYSVKPVETEYAYFCLTEEEIEAQGVPMNETINLIGYLPIFDSGYVHHALAYGSTSPTIDCTNGRPSNVEAVFGYAPGQGPYSPPFNVGGPLGISNFGHRSFLIEVHYNNPQLTEGVLDSSGVRFYWSRTIRDYQMGVTVMGDPSTNLVGIKLGEDAGIYSHSFTCGSECSTLAISDGIPITIHQQYLHMHQDGIRIVHEHVRSGQVMTKSSIDFWDFNQQGNAQTQTEPYQVLPGDSFTTHCFYETDGSVEFGFGSENEMCAVFMYYYPRKFVLGLFPWFCGYDLPLPACNADWNSTKLQDFSDIGRSFGVAPGEGTCVVGVDKTGSPTTPPDSPTTSPVVADTSRSGDAPVFVSLILVLAAVSTTLLQY